MHRMRHWMRLCEANAHTIRVFHGSPERDFTFAHSALYGVRDFGFAASYALDRGHRESAFVHTFDFQFRNLCPSDVLHALFDEHGVEPWPSSAGVFIEHPEFMKILTDAGYDGLTAHDFGFRSDFEELAVWMVVDAAQQATRIAVTEVTENDLHLKHEPK